MSGGCSGSATETTSFVYDGDGKRVQATASGTTTSFIGNYYELTGAQVTKYYFAGTQRIAMRKYTIPQPMTLEYLLGDYLSSTSITTDSNGTKVSEIRYKPWGERRYSWTSGTVTSPAYKLVSYTFTGQYSYMDDPSTTGTTKGFGLIFCNARFYSPYINHFISPDTIVPDPANPQSWNRYSYVSNNPLRYSDPTGHMQQVDDGGGQCDMKCVHEHNQKNNKSNGNDPGSDILDPSVETSIGALPTNYPDYFDLNPNHPDYYALTIARTGAGFSVIIDRYGQSYILVNFGLMTPGGSLTAGRVGDLLLEAPDHVLTSSQISGYLEGLSINLENGAGLGGGATISPGTIKYVPEFYDFELKDWNVKPVGAYAGVFTPSASASISIGRPITNPTINGWPQKLMAKVIPLLP